MSQQPPGQAAPGGDNWPDSLWPDEDDAPGGPGQAPPGPATGPATGPGGGPPRRRFRPGVLGGVVLVAALAGAGIAVAVQTMSSPPGGAAANNQPSSLTPAQPGGNGQPGGQIGGNGVPGGAPGGGGGGQATLFMAGPVTAVSGGSITIGGPARTVTASVTSATRITGSVTSISGIKVGDQVSAQITQQGSKLTAVAIQYPARTPARGGPGG
jgi:hypothetical protein